MICAFFSLLFIIACNIIPNKHNDSKSRYLRMCLRNVNAFAILSIPVFPARSISHSLARSLARCLLPTRWWYFRMIFKFKGKSKWYLPVFGHFLLFHINRMYFRALSHGHKFPLEPITNTQQSDQPLRISSCISSVYAILKRIVWFISSIKLYNKLHFIEFALIWIIIIIEYTGH